MSVIRERLHAHPVSCFRHFTLEFGIELYAEIHAARGHLYVASLLCTITYHENGFFQTIHYQNTKLLHSYKWNKQTNKRTKKMQTNIKINLHVGIVTKDCMEYYYNVEACRKRVAVVCNARTIATSSSPNYI